jgi:hypothetical protein
LLSIKYKYLYYFNYAAINWDRDKVKTECHIIPTLKKSLIPKLSIVTLIDIVTQTKSIQTRGCESINKEKRSPKSRRAQKWQSNTKGGSKFLKLHRVSKIF